MSRRLASAVLCAAVASALAAWAWPSAVRPSVSAPRATSVGERSAYLSAVVDTQGLGGTLVLAYGRSTVPTTLLRLGRIDADDPAGRRATTVAGLAPRTTYHFRFELTTVEGTVASPDQAFTTAGAAATAACRVPALRGRTLAAARRALRRGGCHTGHVRRPVHVRHGRRLVVRWQSVPAGRMRPAGTRVDLRLGARS